MRPVVDVTLKMTGVMEDTTVMTTQMNEIAVVKVHQSLLMRKSVFGVSDKV